MPRHSWLKQRPVKSTMHVSPVTSSLPHRAEKADFLSLQNPPFPTCLQSSSLRNTQHSTASSSQEPLQEQISCIILPQPSSQRGPKAAGSAHSHPTLSSMATLLCTNREIHRKMNKRLFLCPQIQHPHDTGNQESLQSKMSTSEFQSVAEILLEKLD